MGRSLKGTHDEHLMKKLKPFANDEKKSYQTWSRRSTIFRFIG